jgi:quinol monooxygenase YgiN
MIAPLINRREFVGAGAFALLAGCVGSIQNESSGATTMEEMFGLIGQMIAQSGKRDELVAYLFAGTRDMPGNRAYIIGKDLADENSIWITEVWNTKTDHTNSLKLPSVQDAIAKGRPLIADFGTQIETLPVGIDG